MVTVHDVASRSGVSIATVSRTLRAPDRVASETRERVLSAVQELGYRPNRAASGLRGGRTGIVGLVVPDIDNPYFSSLTKGAQARARERGYGLVIVDTTEEAQVESDEVAALAPQIDGIVLVSSRLDDERLAEVARTTSCVLVNRSLEPSAADVPTVMLDERAAARVVLRHLAELGHRRISYVGGPARSWSQARRSLAMQAGADELGLVITELGPVTPDVDGGHAAAEPALAADATAVIAYNDLVAVGLGLRWRDLGVRVPDERSLVGFDDTSVSELFLPRLTSIGPDLRVLGQTAIDLLLDRIGSGRDGMQASSPPHAVELAPHLSVRGSTGPAPVGGR